MAELNSARDLRDALASLIRDYVQHLDFDAPTELRTVRVEANGPGLQVVYSEIEDGSPQLSVSINDFTPKVESADAHKRFLGGR